MNNHENHAANTSTNQFVIDINPLNSEGLICMLTGEDPHEPVSKYIDKFMSGVSLNIIDMPFILLALDVISHSVRTHCNEKDLEFYNHLKEGSSIITIHDDSHLHKGDEDNA